MKRLLASAVGLAALLGFSLSEASELHPKNIVQKVSTVSEGVASADRDINDLEGGVSLALATANIPAPAQGKRLALGIGAGYSYGEPALAVGFSAQPRDHTVLRLAVGGTTDNRYAIGGGIGFSF